MPTPANPDDLVQWLRAQLDDDERLIERNSGEKGLTDEGHFPDYRTNDDEDLDAADDYLGEFNPKRMRAEVNATRRILDEVVDEATGLDMQVDNEFRVGTRDEAAEPYLGDVLLRLLALPYADREGFREEWMPS